MSCKYCETYRMEEIAEWSAREEDWMPFEATFCPRCGAPLSSEVEPLTLDELKAREGKPVYLVHPSYAGWVICAGYEWRQGHETDWMIFAGIGSVSCSKYGDLWWAYDREPGKLAKEVLG